MTKPDDVMAKIAARDPNMADLLALDQIFHLRIVEAVAGSEVTNEDWHAFWVVVAECLEPRMQQTFALGNDKNY